MEGEQVRELVVQQDFVKQLADLTTREGDFSLALHCSLNLLSTLVREAELTRAIIDREVALPNLISLLASTDHRIQLAAVGLINSLLAAATPGRRVDMVRCLQERPAR